MILRASYSALLLLALAGCGAVRFPHAVSTEAELRAALDAGEPTIVLSGDIPLSRPLELKDSGQALQLRGPARLTPAPGFSGRALIDLTNRANVTLLDLSLDGARPPKPTPAGLPPSNQAFARFYRRNGIVIEGGRNIRLRNVSLAHITDFAIIASGTAALSIHGATISDSGSLNDHGRNNTSGGILIEEGTTDFEVRNCSLKRILGNAIWTHANAEPRNARGLIAGNTFAEVGRDAIQIGHATAVRVESNTGNRIGYPVEVVDIETHGTPVALDTAGNVDRTVYQDNLFHDVNGECINLDGFHHGEVRRNVCESIKPFDQYPYAHYGIVMGNNDPGMESESVIIAGNLITGTGYGGLYLIGTGHTVTGNSFRMLNRNGCTGDARIARCNYAPDQPDMLRSGIYLATFGGRKSKTASNTIRDNEIKGPGMKEWCITAAPGLKLTGNTLGDNRCIQDSEKR